jgi:uncharacterized protein (TIGR00297 family)
MGWSKTISEARDRWQSRILVGVVGTLLVLMTVMVLQQAYFLWGAGRSEESVFVAKIIGISTAFACLVLALRAATPAGALSGGMICLILLSGTSSSQYPIVRCALTPLAVLFVLTFLATRAGRQKKMKAGLAEGRRGRSAAQVIANLSIAALSVSSLGFSLVMGGKTCCGTPYHKTWVYPAMTLMCLSALVEATADTVSSEMGQAFGGDPLMIVGLHRVPPGTDGAVTALGSGAGVVAGVLVALAGGWAMRLNVGGVLIALGAGICGLFFDSFLGATLEQRGWIGNDLVNFTSTLFAAVLAAGVYRFFVI